MVGLKLTAQHCSLLTTMLHYCIENHADDLDSELIEDMKGLCTFFAAVALEPWKFPATPTEINTAQAEVGVGGE